MIEIILGLRVNKGVSLESNKSNALSDVTKAQIPVPMTVYLAVACVLAWKAFNSRQQTKRSSDVQW